MKTRPNKITVNYLADLSIRQSVNDNDCFQILGKIHQ